MFQFIPAGMQGLTIDQGSIPTVKVITQERMTEILTMHPYLMSAATG